MIYDLGQDTRRAAFEMKVMSFLTHARTYYDCVWNLRTRLRLCFSTAS
jgi:hypothetical protein